MRSWRNKSRCRWSRQSRRWMSERSRRLRFRRIWSRIRGSRRR